MKREEIYSIVIFSLLGLIVLCQFFATNIRYVYIQVVLFIILIIVTTFGVIEKKRKR